MSGKILRDGEVIPEIAQFLKSVHVKRTGQTTSGVPIPDYYGEMWVDLETANGLEDDEVIELFKINNRLYAAKCPGCNDFQFERTSVDALRDWLQTHNRKEHKGKLKLYDSTKGS